MKNNEKELDFLYNDDRITQTGSRYWNKINSDLVTLAIDTDYDFVAEYSINLVEEFLERGYVIKNAEFSNGKLELAKKYSDSNTIFVLYYENIQIILKNNVSKYIDLQNILTPEFYARYLWKRHNPISKIQAVLNILLNSDNFYEEKNGK